MKNNQKLLSVILSFILLLSVVVLPSIVGAANEDVTNNSNEVEVEALEQADNHTYTAEEIDQIIKDTVAYTLENGVVGEWQAIGVAKAGYEVPESYKETLKNTVNSQIKIAIDNDRLPKITDLARLTLGILAIGEDPTDFQGINLIEHIYNSEGNMTQQGTNGPIYALIALDANNYEIPKDAKWQRQDIIDEIMSKELEEGGWAFFGNELDFDITAMAVIALANYQSHADVKNAIEKAYDKMLTMQEPEGGFDGGPFVGGVTSESTSQTIIGLSAYGLDAQSDRFTSEAGNDLIDHLLSHLTDDGGFKHTAQDSGSNGMATEQALQALVAYRDFLNGQERLYTFSSVLVEVAGDSEEIAFEQDRKANENLLVGEEKIVKEGQPGSKTIIYQVEQNFKGEQMGEPVEIRTDFVDPINEVVEYGTAVKAELGQALVLNEADDQNIFIGNTGTVLKINQYVPEGTEVLIKDISDGVEIPDSQNLVVAGDVFEISVLSPDKEPVTGSFNLKLSYDNKQFKAENTDVYYLNDENAMWDKKSSQKHPDQGVLAIDVSHFSTYGVFAEVAEEEKVEDPKQDEKNDLEVDPNSEGSKDNIGQNNSDEEKGLELSSDDNVAEVNVEKTENSDTLPKTATNSYTVMLVGLIVLLVGCGFIMFRKRKV